MSMYDFITINATWDYMNKPRQFNCHNQIHKLSKQPNSEIRVEDFKNKNGCGERITKHVRYRVSNIKFHSCLCDFRNSSMNTYLNMYEQYEIGSLPFKGNLMDQPAYIIDVMGLIENLYYKREEQQLKDQQKANERSKNGR